MEASTREIIRDLLSRGRELAPSERERIRSLGDDAVRSLLELLAESHPADGPSEDEPKFDTALEVVRLLGELRAAEAASPLIRLLPDVGDRRLVWCGIQNALSAIGAPAIPTLLETFEQTRDPDIRGAIVSVLSSMELRDDRVFELLVRYLEEDLGLAAMCLSGYGDPRAVPELSKAYDAFVIGAGPVPDLQPLCELKETIERLGGSLNDSQRERYLRAVLPNLERLSNSLQGSASRPELAAELAPSLIGLVADLVETVRVLRLWVPPAGRGSSGWTSN